MKNILIGKNESSTTTLLGQFANRHGMVAGATGTGKSATLMSMIEGFSKMGVPTFIADVKGDIAGLSQKGTANAKIKERTALLGQDWTPTASPVTFWDIYGKQGHPARTTVTLMGATLLGRLLELNDTRQGVLEVLFVVAQDEDMRLDTLDDLRELLLYASDNIKSISKNYGLISNMTVSGIQRAILGLTQADGDKFFSEEPLDFADFVRTTEDGRGYVNILAADSLILKPKLYTSFLLWLLTEMFEQLPEIGDMDKPRFVIFFDEAHLIFDDITPVLARRLEQVVRLIRSKGVGVYFCSQKPTDVPDNILGQLGNRVQHALRAFTIRDQKAVKVAAETFAMNGKVDVVDIITKLGVGEALVSMLDEHGTPTPVEHVLIAAPECRIGAITDQERQAVIDASDIGDKYDSGVNEFVHRRYSSKQGKSLIDTMREKYQFIN